MSCIGTGTDDLSKMNLDEKVEESMKEYEKIGLDVSSRYTRVLELLSRYTELDQLGSLVLYELEY